MLDPSLLNELFKVYHRSSPEEKNAFADTVNKVLAEEQQEMVQKSEEAYQKEEAEFKSMESIPFKDPVKGVPPKKKKGTRNNIYGYLSDFEITHLAHKGLINPFIDYEFGKDREKVPYGLVDYGYKVRISSSYIPLSSANEDILDPKQVPKFEMAHHKQGKIMLAPGEVIMCMTIETLKIPDSIFGQASIVEDYLRCGTVVYCPDLKPSFDGRITFLVKNLNVDKHVILYPNEGIMEVKFIRPWSMSKKTYQKFSEGKKKKP